MKGKPKKTVGSRKGRPAARNGSVPTIQALAAEVDALQQRLTQMEARQKAEEKVYHVPQSLAELRPAQTPPAGMTPMQAIMGRLDVEETTEELLAQLKALD